MVHRHRLPTVEQHAGRPGGLQGEGVPEQQPPVSAQIQEGARMRAKLLVAFTAACVVMVSAPLFADPQAIGDEFKLNTEAQSLPHNPVAAFNGAGNAVVVWENEISGLRGRFVAADGSALGSEIGLVANSNLPSIPGEGDVVGRKNPAVLYLASGKFLVFWTSELA